jgi:hypothetical protein
LGGKTREHRELGGREREREREREKEERGRGNTATSRSGLRSFSCQVYWNFLMDSHTLLYVLSVSSLLPFL